MCGVVGKAVSFVRSLCLARPQIAAGDTSTTTLTRTVTLGGTPGPVVTSQTTTTVVVTASPNPTGGGVATETRIVYPRSVTFWTADCRPEVAPAVNLRRLNLSSRGRRPFTRRASHRLLQPQPSLAAQNTPSDQHHKIGCKDALSGFGETDERPDVCRGTLAIRFREGLP
jgi:hypothetical protein